MNTEILAWVFFGLMGIAFIFAAASAVALRWELALERGKHLKTEGYMRAMMAREAPGGLTFNDLRQANVRRVGQFKNGKGEPAHAKADGSDWLLSAWCNAVCGELGEAANLIKKIERGDFTLEEKRAELAREFADVATYLDLLAFRAGVNLGQATAAKFNEVSQRVGVDVFLPVTEGQDTPYAMALKERLDQYAGLLMRGVQHMVWCSGSGDFGPGGQAEVGWNNGPRNWMRSVKEALDAPFMLAGPTKEAA